MNTVSVEVADPAADNVTVVGFKVAPGPPETLEARVRVPLKPLRLVRVITDVPEEPAGKLRETGFEEMAKSSCAITVTVTVAEWDTPPLRPITPTE